MPQKAKKTSRFVFQRPALRLSILAALMLQIAAPSVAQSEKPSRTQHYTIVYSNMPQNAGLIRLPRNATPAQIKKMLPSYYVVAAPVPPQYDARSYRIAPVKQWMNTLQHAEKQMSSPSSLTSRQGQALEYAIQGLQNRPREEQVAGINNWINKVPYVSDTTNYGSDDYWATPDEFIAHGGDCEDYAIAKYASLRALGVPADQMHIAIVHNASMPKDTGHAILIVHEDKGDVVLDNYGTVKAADSVKQYTPIMSINGSNWWENTGRQGP
jgi:predicted transglutaminase-like cysteine proteinase